MISDSELRYFLACYSKFETSFILALKTLFQILLYDGRIMNNQLKTKMPFKIFRIF